VPGIHPVHRTGDAHAEQVSAEGDGHRHTNDVDDVLSPRRLIAASEPVLDVLEQAGGAAECVRRDNLANGASLKGRVKPTTIEEKIRKVPVRRTIGTGTIL
jgi:hypothetical protein